MAISRQQRAVKTRHQPSATELSMRPFTERILARREILKA